MLKGHRYVVQDDVTYFMNETAERGGVVVLSTAGSGIALDQSSALVTYASNSSGKIPVGILQNDMVNIDLTRQILNRNKDEVQIGGKVTITVKGWHITDKINGTPTAGSKGYLQSSGYIGITQVSELVNPTLGRFMSTKDEAGFAKFEINLPQ